MFQISISPAITEAPKLGVDFDMVFIDGDKRTYTDTDADSEDRPITAALSSGSNLLLPYCMVHIVFLLNIIMVVLPIVIS